MDIVFIPTLKHMAMAKVTTAVCEHPDIYPYTLRNFRFDQSEEEKQFCEKAEKILPLAKTLQPLALIWVKTLCLEIISWRTRHYKILYSAVDNLIKFCWRSDGSIDSSKTAEALVRNENFYYIHRFNLACCYFLEKDIQDLWMRIPKNEKYFSFSHLFHAREIIEFWLPWVESGGSAELLDILKSSISDLPDDVFLVELTIAEVCLRRFVEKLPRDKRLEWLKKITKHRLLTRDLAHFLVSGQLRNQQIAVFTEDASVVLSSFLSWPLQIMFIDVAGHLWDHLSVENFLTVLIDICNKINDGQKDFDYSELLNEFWTISPLPHREFVGNKLKNPDKRSLRTKIEKHIPHLFTK
ncbi:hypothetical protein AVEN_115842-1 [Araneus ventricosus]|uniref:Uncharacterized protein n=1 Tax=Araneus ventricosus TaxID=182803 RepID=A0A4Y2ISW4_ARAVE|nr:hypothetical protein AVEN_115842-1 [Araneus ventricosus]